MQQNRFNEAQINPPLVEHEAGTVRRPMSRSHWEQHMKKTPIELNHLSATRGRFEFSFELAESYLIGYVSVPDAAARSDEELRQEAIRRIRTLAVELVATAQQQWFTPGLRG